MAKNLEKAIVLHTFGVQVGSSVRLKDSSSELLLGSGLQA